MALLMYMDEEYKELGVTPVEEILFSRLGVEAQFYLGELLAVVKRLRRVYTLLPGGRGDIDIVLMEDNRPVIGYEVKIGETSRNEAIRRIRNHGIPRTGLISLSERPQT